VEFITFDDYDVLQHDTMQPSCNSLMCQKEILPPTSVYETPRFFWQ